MRSYNLCELAKNATIVTLSDIKSIDGVVTLPAKGSYLGGEYTQLELSPKQMLRGSHAGSTIAVRVAGKVSIDGASSAGLLRNATGYRSGYWFLVEYEGNVYAHAGPAFFGIDPDGLYRSRADEAGVAQGEIISQVNAAPGTPCAAAP